MNLDAKKIIKSYSKFIWEYQVGENIVFNLNIISLLEKDKDAKFTNFYNKPIIVHLVSIIEVILYDFLYRLSYATNDFPITLTNKRNDMKKALFSDHKTITLNGHNINKLKNYTFTQLVRKIKYFGLLGKDDSIYNDLVFCGEIRNRVHILNYYKNLEVDEKKVFTTQRVEKVKNILVNIVEIIKDQYPRPAESLDQSSYWISKLIVL